MNSLPFFDHQMVGEYPFRTLVDPRMVVERYPMEDFTFRFTNDSLPFLIEIAVLAAASLFFSRFWYWPLFYISFCPL